jgi:putative PIN family toxin of toxin-antitoxin system
MIVYAVIDTNVIVSAMLSSHDDAATVRVMEKLFTGEIISLYSAEILDEYYNVLHRDKFPFSEDDINGMLSAIEKYGICVDAAPSGEILPDMKDLPFYEVVAGKRDDDAYLITGNIKHFPQKPFIVTANQMLDILKG